MFGIAFIIIGIVLLLQWAGIFGTVSSGLIWGIVFIAIGVFIAIRSSARRNRREEWMAKRHERRQGEKQDMPDNK